MRIGDVKRQANRWSVLSIHSRSSGAGLIRTSCPSTTYAVSSFTVKLPFDVQAYIASICLMVVAVEVSAEMQGAVGTDVLRYLS